MRIESSHKSWRNAHGIASRSWARLAIGGLAIGHAVSTFAGCGGAGVSASDMRQYAIRRPSDDDEDRDATAMTSSTPSQQPKAAPASTPPAPASEPDERATESVVSTPASREATKSVAKPLSDTESPPATLLSPEERARRTVANLQRIAEAFDKHVREKGYFPARATFRGKRDALLSWRVALLPYLGYEELYAKFHMDEPWNSRHNHELLAHIPSVYQSPERFDDHTNYVVPVASSTAFGGNRIVPLSNFEDGVENTVVVAEVDDVAAVPWTAPRELDLDLKVPNRALGKLRGDSFFVIWGSGQVGRIATSASPLDLRAMFTHESGEDFTSDRVDQPLFPPRTRVGPGVAAASSNAATVESRTTPAAETSSSDSELTAMACTFRQQSAAALAQGHERDAVAWFLAAALVGPPGGDWASQYRWVPAMRRPTPVLRFGVGLLYTGPRADGADGARLPLRQTWSATTGDFGKHLIERISRYLETQCADTLLSQWNTSARAGTSRLTTSLMSGEQGDSLAPGVHFLGTGRESVLQKLAAREMIDVLLLVDWRATPRGWSAGLRLFDVRRDAELLRLPRLRSADIEVARANPLADNPFEETMRQVSQFLEENCAFQDLPPQLEPRHATRRLNMLATAEEDDPLPALAEMRFYHDLGYVDSAQLLKAYQAKLGKDRGIDLMLGTAGARKDALKPWLPIAQPLDGHLSRMRANRTLDIDD